MVPAKAKSACKRVKHSRGNSASVLNNDKISYANNRTIEHQENFQPSFDQPSPHTIDQSITYSSNDQPSLSSQSTDRSTFSSADHSISQPTNGSSSSSSDHRAPSSSAVNRSVPQPADSSTSSSASLLSSNDRSPPSTSINGSKPSPVNSLTSSSSSDDRSPPSTSINGSKPPPVNSSTSSSSSKKRPPPSTATNRSRPPPVNSSTSSSSSNKHPPPSTTTNPSRTPPVNSSTPSSSNHHLSSSAFANRSGTQSVNNPSVRSPSASLSSNNCLRSLSSGKSSGSQSINGSSSINSSTSSSSSTHASPLTSTNRSTSTNLSKSLSDHLSSSQSATNLSTLSQTTASHLDTAGSTASDHTDDFQNDAVRKESAVWEYAERNIDTQTATCRKCNAIIKTTNGSTTGLRKHLNQVHKIVTMKSTATVKKSAVSPTLRKQLHELVVKSIIEDSRTFNDFRRPGMLKFLRKAVPGYVPPHRTTVSRRLKRLHGFYQQRLRQQMLEVSKISLTCDFWSDRSLKSYLCITGHHVTHDFGYHSTILSFDEFYDRHHGIRVAKIVREKLSHFNLHNKLLCFTTDGAGNMRTMCENLTDVEFDWIWCVAHRFHLTVNNAFGFWPKKKKDKAKDKNNNNTNDDDNPIIINNGDNHISNNFDNDRGDGYDDATEIGNFKNDEDEQNSWDDATKDRSNEQHIPDADHMNENEDLNSNDGEEDEISDINRIIYGDAGDSLNVEEAQRDATSESVNPNDIKFYVDDETFVDYMVNNHLIRDDWDMDLNRTNNVVVNEQNKRIILSVIKKCRSLVTTLKQSTVLNGYFNQARLEFDIKRGLPMDCITRWNSTFFLIDSFINTRDLIMKFFSDKYRYDVRRALINGLVSIELHHDDWQVLMDLHAVLKPFYLATKLMSVRQYPTAGLCFYVVKLLLHYLMKDDANDSTQIKSLKIMLLSQYEHYFCSDKEQLNVLKKYAYFDPMGYAVLTENDIRTVEQEIKEIIRNEKISQDGLPTALSLDSFSSASSATASIHNKSLSTIDQFLLACGESSIIHDRNIRNRRLTIDEEFHLYKEKVTSFHREYRTRAFALDFWKQYCTDLPILSQLARSYLSASGTSLASESAFSISAYVARKERSRLSSDNLSFTMFMKDKIASEE